MFNNVDAMWDEHLSRSLREHEERLAPVYCGSCYKCDEELYDGDEAYEIDGCYYCENCMDDYKVVLTKEED